jgi:hypothetical protein
MVSRNVGKFQDSVAAARFSTCSRFPAADPHGLIRALLNWFHVRRRPHTGLRTNKHMRSRTIIIRLLALIVLATSAFDYYAFDRWDPSAPMNSAELAIHDLAPHTAITVSARTTSSADDNCLCCSPCLQPRRPALPRVHLSSSLIQIVNAWLPSADPILIERPPRA